MVHLEPAHLAIVRGIINKCIPGIAVTVFGSRATGVRLKRHSDLDLCLLDPTLLPETTFMTLITAFADSDLPFKVDIVDWHRLTPEFQDAIRRDLVPLPPL